MANLVPAELPLAVEWVCLIEAEALVQLVFVSFLAANTTLHLC